MTSKKLSKKTKNKVLRRYVFSGGVGSLNYEKMQGLSYCYSMYPVLKELYQDDPSAMKKAMQLQLQFFNTNPYLTPFILGVDIGIEEQEGVASLDTIPPLKTGLMGPLAGLGDTLLISTPGAIFGGIAASMAVKGNPMGTILWIAVLLALKSLVIPFFRLGYDSGIKLVSTLKDQLQNITGSISIVGLMVVGSLISTVVNANVIAEYKSGDLIVNGQEILDSVMPNLIPAIFAALVFWLLGKKFTPIKLIFLILVIAVALSYLGILG